MGRLRSCCLVLIAATAGAAFWLHAIGASALAVVALLIGTAALAAITPFPAYDRAARTRVVAAAFAYVIASALASSVAIAGGPSPAGAVTLALPLAGALIAWWAYRTRTRIRMTGYARYRLS